jgi:hypothetical protein
MYILNPLKDRLAAAANYMGSITEPCPNLQKSQYTNLLTKAASDNNNNLYPTVIKTLALGGENGKKAVEDKAIDLGTRNLWSEACQYIIDNYQVENGGQVAQNSHEGIAIKYILEKHTNDLDEQQVARLKELMGYNKSASFSTTQDNVNHLATDIFSVSPDRSEVEQGDIKITVDLSEEQIEPAPAAATVSSVENQGLSASQKPALSRFWTWLTNDFKGWNGAAKVAAWALIIFTGVIPALIGIPLVCLAIDAGMRRHSSGGGKTDPGSLDVTV